MAREIGWEQYDQLKAQGLADREIARQWEIPWGTFHREKQKHDSVPAAHRCRMRLPCASSPSCPN